MNYIPGVAKMLGVEIGEEFEVLPIEERFAFNDEKLEHLSKAKGVDEDLVLRELLNGDCVIKRDTWKPVLGKLYYFCSISNIDLWGITPWTSDEIDWHRLNSGIAFETLEETIARSQEILKLIKPNNYR